MLVSSVSRKHMKKTTHMGNVSILLFRGSSNVGHFTWNSKYKNHLDKIPKNATPKASGGKEGKLDAF